MKVVTKYVSDDGLEFLDLEACRRYEELCVRVAAIMATLLPRPNLPSCNFENGAGYIQHDPAKAYAARASLLLIANKIMPHQWFDQSIADASIDSSWAGRLIGDMSEKCLYTAWRRFQCMTADFREYGQPYYATNPEAAKDVCLNEASK